MASRSIIYRSLLAHSLAFLFLTNRLLRKVLFLLCYHHDHHFYNYHYVDYDDSDDIMMMIIIIMIIISVMVPYVSFTWTCSFPFHSAHFLADHSS